MTSCHVETAWASGVFEAHGSVVDRGLLPPRLQLRDSNPERALRFAAAVGAGRVYGPYGPYAGSIGRGTWWLWVASGADARVAADVLIEYVGEPHRCRLMRHVLSGPVGSRQPEGDTWHAHST